MNDQTSTQEQRKERRLEVWKVIATFLDAAARLADLWHR